MHGCFELKFTESSEIVEFSERKPFRKFQIRPGLNANEIQIPYDKNHEVSSPKHAPFCQIWSNMKMSNICTKHGVLIKQYLRSILKFWV